MVNSYRQLLALLRQQEKLLAEQNEAALDALSTRIGRLSLEVGKYTGDFQECPPHERVEIRSTIEEILAQTEKNQVIWRTSIEANLSRQETHQATRRFFEALQRRQVPLNRYDRSV